MRQLIWSEMYTFPAESTATPVGLFSDAEVARPPSPPNPAVPVPATVVTVPVVAPIMRTHAEEESVKYKLPERSTASEGLKGMYAVVALMPSAVDVPDPPAKLVIILVPAAIIRMRYSSPI